MASSDSSHEMMVSHADRMWQAERENAARIQDRINLTAAAIVALLGLGLFGFVWTLDDKSHPVLGPIMMVAVHVLLVLALLFFALSLGRLYSGPTASASATDELEFESKDSESPLWTAVYNRIISAYTDLKQSNARHRLRLRKAQVSFVLGMACVFLSVILYLLCSLPSKIHVESVNHGENSTNK